MSIVSAHKQRANPLQEILEGLTQRQQTVLRAAQVRSPEDLFSLLHSFPSLSSLELPLPTLRLATRSSIRSTTWTAMADGGEEKQAAPEFGALPPADAPAQFGFEVPVKMPEEPPAPWPPMGGAQKARVRVDLSPDLALWPIRDQGRRGTCVAFALAACREHLGFVGGRDPARFDLSEQFLYWATKSDLLEPYPGREGTLLIWASKALEERGICLEATWPYRASPISANISQQPPPTRPPAIKRALAFATPTGLYRSGGLAGAAAALRGALESKRRPVAVSLPVFADRWAPGSNNWNSPVAYAFGKVLDPPATAIVKSGHAVCVTGFVEDPSELSGGYFFFRNSWGVSSFGRSLPADGYFGPEPGYGQISATYVDRYLWEMCQL